MNRLTPNEIKNVIPYVDPDPKRIDMVVTRIQQKFATDLLWLEKSFGRSILMSEKRDEKEYYFPGVYVGSTKDLLNMMEQDNYDAFSFFYAWDVENAEKYENTERNLFSRMVSCIFWINVDKANNGLVYIENLKDEIIECIKNTRYLGFSEDRAVQSVDIVNIYDQPENIFKGFSLELTSTQWLYRPYTGLKIDLQCYYLDKC